MENKGPKRILVTDDEKDTVEMIATLLEMEGYNVFSAHSEAEAMKKERLQAPFAERSTPISSPETIIWTRIDHSARFWKEFDL